jgi:hypothetical protein
MHFRFPRWFNWLDRFSPRRPAALLASPASSAGRRNLQRRLRRFVSVTLPALLVVTFVSACSPAYNWRTVTDAAEGYTVDLPAKPTMDERQVAIAGRTLPMHVRAAETQHAVFAVAVVDLPSDDARLGQAVADDLRQALARHVSASAVEHAVPVPVSTGASVSGVDIVATGSAGQAHRQRTIHAWIAVRGRHVYQAAIIAAQAPPEDQSDQFFGSLKLN